MLLVKKINIFGIKNCLGKHTRGRADLPSSRVRHVWFFQRRCYEESGSTDPAGGRAQPCEGFPGSCRFETILSAECSTWPTADWSIFKSLQTPESLFLFVVKWIFARFSKPLFINRWIFKGKLNLKSVQKPVSITRAILYKLVYLSVLNISLSEYSWISVSRG